MKLSYCIIAGYVFLIHSSTLLAQPPEWKQIKYDRDGWVVTTGFCSGESVTSQEAQREAKRDARRQAVALVCGIDVRSITRIDGGLFKARLSEFEIWGLSAKDTTLNMAAETSPASHGFVTTNYYVLMACSVATLNPAEQWNMDLRVMLEPETIVSGGNASLTIRPNKDCYITVFSQWADGRVGVLFPNERIKSVQLKAGEVFKVPNPDDPILKGMVLTYRTLPSEPENIEYIQVVATKNEVPFYGGLGTSALKRHELAPNIWINFIDDPDMALQEFYHWLLAIPNEERRTEQIMYRVVAK